MSCVGNSFLCYGGNCCVQQWDLLCWVLELSVVCDKGEGSRYIRWKILHSRWTVVLQLQWSALQWTLCGRYFIGNGQCPRNNAVPPVYIRPPTGTKLHDRHICWWQCHPELPYWCPSSLLLPPRAPKYTSKPASHMENQNKQVQVTISHFHIMTWSQPTNLFK